MESMIDQVWDGVAWHQVNSLTVKSAAHDVDIGKSSDDLRRLAAIGPKTVWNKLEANRTSWTASYRKFKHEVVD